MGPICDLVTLFQLLGFQDCAAVATKERESWWASIHCCINKKNAKINMEESERNKAWGLTGDYVRIHFSAEELRLLQGVMQATTLR